MAGRTLAALRSTSLGGSSFRRLVGSRDFFGGKDRPRASQSKVLSGEDGPLFTVESELLQLMWETSGESPSFCFLFCKHFFFCL